MGVDLKPRKRGSSRDRTRRSIRCPPMSSRAGHRCDLTGKLVNGNCEVRHSSELNESILKKNNDLRDLFEVCRVRSSCPGRLRGCSPTRSKWPPLDSPAGALIGLPRRGAESAGKRRKRPHDSPKENGRLPQREAGRSAQLLGLTVTSFSGWSQSCEARPGTLAASFAARTFRPET